MKLRLFGYEIRAERTSLKHELERMRNKLLGEHGARMGNLWIDQNGKVWDPREMGTTHLVNTVALLSRRFADLPVDTKEAIRRTWPIYQLMEDELLRRAGMVRTEPPEYEPAPHGMGVTRLMEEADYVARQCALSQMADDWHGVDLHDLFPEEPHENVVDNSISTQPGSHRDGSGDVHIEERESSEQAGE